jgi:hypothetical protein
MPEKFKYEKDNHENPLLTRRELGSLAREVLPQEIAFSQLSRDARKKLIFEKIRGHRGCCVLVS